MSKKIIVYLDGSVNVKGFKDLHSKCLFLLSPYDSPSQRRSDVKYEFAVQSKLQWKDWHTPWGEDFFPFKEKVASKKLPEIYSIIGKNPSERRDGLHLDSAYKSKSQLFLTPDKDNICNHRESLEPLLGFRIFYPDTELQLVRDFIINFSK